MNAHDLNTVARFVQRIAAPLDVLETEARKIWPAGAERGSLYVLHAGGDDFIYQWGDAMVSRNEAARRLGAS